MSALSGPKAAKPLAGMRIGVIRELMVKESPGDAVIVDAINKELAVLHSLGAELVESTGPGYTDDPAIPNMAFTFEHAIAEVVRSTCPRSCRGRRMGSPSSRCRVTTSRAASILVAAAALKAPWPANLDFRRIFGNAPEDRGGDHRLRLRFQFAEYLVKRGDARVFDWKTLNANAKYFSDQRRAAMANWENKAIDIRTEEVAFIMRRKDVDADGRAQGARSRTTSRCS